MTDPTTPKKLSRLMERFCNEFLIDINRTAAYIRAGGAERSAGQQGSMLMKDPRILARVNELMREREESTRVKGFKVLEELAVVALSSVDHYDVDAYGHVHAKPDAPPGAMRAISKVKRRVTSTLNAANEIVTVVETEFQLWDKNPAVTNALKHLGLLKEVVEHRDLTLEDILREAAGKSIDAPETTDASDGVETK